MKIICLILAISGLALITSGLIKEYKKPAIIKVGFIDSGINLNHPIFKNRKIESTAVSTYYVGTSDSNGHGSHIAGIIAMNTSPNIELYNIKNIFSENDETKYTRNFFCATSGFHPHPSDFEMFIDLKNDEEVMLNQFQDFQRGIEYAHDKGIKILNLSQVLTLKKDLTPKEVEDLKKVFNRAKDYGILVVVASGNEKYNLDELTSINNIYPCALGFANIICVGNINSNIEPVSNYGKNYIDIWAHGQNVYSAGIDFKYYAFSGSSQATAKITSLAALIWATDDSMNYLEVKAKVYERLQYKDSLTKVSKTGLYLHESKPE